MVCVKHDSMSHRRVTAKQLPSASFSFFPAQTVTEFAPVGQQLKKRKLQKKKRDSLVQWDSDLYHIRLLDPLASRHEQSNRAMGSDQAVELGELRCQRSGLCWASLQEGQGQNLDKDGMKFCGLGKKTLNAMHIS